MVWIVSSCFTIPFVSREHWKPIDDPDNDPDNDPNDDPVHDPDDDSVHDPDEGPDEDPDRPISGSSSPTARSRWTTWRAR